MLTYHYNLMKLSTKLILIWISKALRSFHNGAFSAAFVYFSYLFLNYKDTMLFAIFVAGAIVSGMYKSILLLYVQKYLKIYTVLILFMLYVIPYLFFFQFNVRYFYYYQQLAVMVFAGFFSLDGQDIMIFQDLQSNVLCNGGQSQKKNNNLKFYSRIGYIFQALGCGFALFYMDYNLQKIDFVTDTRNKQILILLYFLGHIIIGLICLFFIWKYQDSDNKEVQIQLKFRQNNQTNNNKIKMFTFANGFAFGLISPPFLIYFLDLKYSFYFDKIALILVSFFLLKGIGQELMEKYKQFERFFKYWNIIANISLASTIVILYSQNLSVLLLILCFPVWNYSKVKLKQQLNIQKHSVQQTKLWQKLIYWQRFGAACGIVASGFSLRILYTRAHFGYPFVLCGLLKQLIQYEISSSFQKYNLKQVKITQHNFQPIQQQPDNQILNNKIHSQANQQKAISKKKLYLILSIICLMYLTLFAKDLKFMNYYQDYFLKEVAAVYRIKGDRYNFPYVKPFNVSLAQYLVRQNITNVKFINCDDLCLSQYKNRKEYYQQLIYHHTNTQWIHYASMDYFRTIKDVSQGLSLITDLPKQVQGFSIVWQNPLRYNKIPVQIHSYIIAFSELHNFFYAEMPSLNLRGIQNKIFLIFTREKRQANKLHPPFIKRAPTKNIVAIQQQLRLANSHKFLRQFILYHLHRGVDKFFFYNNDRDEDDPKFYDQGHNVGQLSQKCFKRTLRQEMDVLGDIWQQFYDHIVYIPWRMKDIQAKMYPQQQGYSHYGMYFRHVAKFTIRTDNDEYVFPSSDKYLPDYLEELLEKHSLTMIEMIPVRFIAMLCHKKQLVIQEYLRDATYSLETVNLTKSIGLTVLMMDYRTHQLATINGLYAPYEDPRTQINYFHYHMNNTEKQLMIDETMKQYVDQLKQSCKGKCTDTTLIPTCPNEYLSEMMEKFCLMPK